MTTSIKNIFFFTLIVITFASCSTDGIEEIISANNVTERVDIKITGETDQYIYEENEQSDASIDLVDFESYGQVSNTFGFQVRLNGDKILNVTVQDDQVSNSWEQNGASYDVFAAQDLNDKSRYVIFELTDNSIGETRVYSSNNINNSTAIINAFSIQEYNNNQKEILTRISHVDLVEDNTGETITLNGTFRGAITF